MSAVQSPPPGPPPPKSPRLPKLRQDLKLYESGQHRDGSPSWRILDPVRNRFFEIGWLEFELLARWAEHGTVEALADAVQRETPLTPSEEEVEGFAEFLKGSQLVVPDDPESMGRLQRSWMAAKRPWYEQLFHNYLFFRFPLVRPDRFLERTLGAVELFYTRGFMLLVLSVFVIDLYLLTRELDELHRSFKYFFNLQGGLYFLVAASFSKVVHELAHAYTAKRYGVRVPAMGVAFLVMWPFLYTDTGETWKLSDRRKQFAIASAGIVSELVLAVFATLLWTVSPDGTMKNIFFILATTTWVMTLAINASPFMRFDGYFLLSDMLDFPNLHERSSACARWWIRRRFFNLKEPVPEPTFDARQRRGLVAFALFVWAYRLVVFLGIALVVYHAFYKPLGVLLFVMEIVWFIVRPVWGEMRYLLKRIGMIRLAWDAFVMLFVALVFLVWLVPVTSQVTAPAVLIASREQALFSPLPARVAEVLVRPGERVEEGQVLVRLESPELDLRARNAALSLATARTEYLRGVATSNRQERTSVLNEQANEAIAGARAVAEERALLTLTAGSAGVVKDMKADLVAGRWIGPRELMLRVVSQDSAIIEAYVTDSQIGGLTVGQDVRFIADMAGVASLKGAIVAIDKTGTKQLQHALLAGPYGGDLPAVIDKKGVAVVKNAAYRVLIEPREAVPPMSFATRGTVRIQTDLTLVAENFVWRALSLVVRESGI
jgi:putative peptide zinc metalloprotease protein